MPIEQGIVFAEFGITLAMFVWNRIRFDVVAMPALLAVANAGIVPVDRLFDGFVHPAVVTVAAAVVIRQGLVIAARRAGPLRHVYGSQQCAQQPGSMQGD